MARQLSFDLPVRTARSREDFFVSPANAAAVGLIEAWQGWPARKLVLSGPTGAGKTHLAHVWAMQANARIVDAASLPAQDIPALATGNIAIEDAECIAGNRPAEEALFHLHNLTLAEGHSLLLTARTAPNRWGLGLPDLASRMEATTLAELSPPDDALLMAVMMKLFTDRQLNPAPGVLPYLTRRIDRSFAAAQQVVAALDAAALDTGRAINTGLARQVLDNLSD